MRFPKDKRLLLLVGATALAEAAAVLLLLAGRTTPAVAASAPLHALAAFLSLRAAMRSRGPLPPVEKDLVLLCAAAVPLFGPAIAWSIPPRRAEPRPAEGKRGGAAEEASLFDRYADHVKPHIPDSERTVFSGNYEKDLARELDIESYVEVLRHGKTDQKRNALKRLADLGEPRHLRLVRERLEDPDQEVRLYAYSELERLSRVHEDRIMRLRKATAAPESAPEESRALAQAHFDYGASGIQDEEMAAYHFRLAQKHATQARARGDADPACCWIESLALARLKDPRGALEALDRLDPAARALAQTRIAYAELAYRDRDFDRVRDEAEALVQANAEIPDWMKALGAKRRTATGETAVADETATGSLAGPAPAAEPGTPAEAEGPGEGEEPSGLDETRTDTLDLPPAAPEVPPEVAPEVAEEIAREAALPEPTAGEELPAAETDTGVDVEEARAEVPPPAPEPPAHPPSPDETLTEFGEER